MSIRELENIMHQLVHIDDEFSDSELCDIRFDVLNDSVTFITEVNTLKITKENE